MARRYLYPGGAAIRAGRRGQRKKWIRRVQDELHRRGYSGFKADGTWDPRTKAAVVRFQRRHDLRGDGIPGPITWGSLFGPASVRHAGPAGGKWPWIFCRPGVNYANNHLSSAMNLIGAHLFLKHRKRLVAVSGRRTLAQQWHLYNGWRRGLPGFNLAAYPNANAPHIRNGGSAYDAGVEHRNGGGYVSFFNDGDAARLARRFGVVRTVPSEAWHCERR